MGEAFEAVTAVLKKSTATYKNVFMLSDGKPYNRAYDPSMNSEPNSRSQIQYSYPRGGSQPAGNPGASLAQYLYQIVPQQAQALKNIPGVLLVVGMVDSDTGNPTQGDDLGYFLGLVNPRNLPTFPSGPIQYSATYPPVPGVPDGVCEPPTPSCTCHVQRIGSPLNCYPVQTLQCELQGTNVPGTPCVAISNCPQQVTLDVTCWANPNPLWGFKHWATDAPTQCVEKSLPLPAASQNCAPCDTWFGSTQLLTNAPTGPHNGASGCVATGGCEPYGSCQCAFSVQRNPSIVECAIMHSYDKTLWPIPSMKNGQPLIYQIVAEDGVDTTRPFPYVTDAFVNNTFDLGTLSCCKITPTPKPTTLKPTTSSPTRPPTTHSPGGTLAPTTRSPTAKSPTSSSPVTAAPGNSLDLYVLLDFSNSITWHETVCNYAIKGSITGTFPPVINPDPPHIASKKCWDLFLNLTQNIANGLALGATDASNVFYPGVGWMGSSLTSTGLKVTVQSFDCKDQQTKPIATLIEAGTGVPAVLKKALKKSAKGIPNSGTCPALAIDDMVLAIDQSLNPPNPSRLHKVVVVVTDAIWYDLKTSSAAMLGWDAFGVTPRYVIGLPGGEQGSGTLFTDVQVPVFDLIAGDKTKVMTITQPPAAPVVANLIASDVLSLLWSNQYPSAHQAAYCGFQYQKNCADAGCTWTDGTGCGPAAG